MGANVPATRVRSRPLDQTSHPSMAVIPDVREDEEQAIKMQEIINLLVAGGYFRARIKGLNNFDKVVGGMSWAIEMSNVDLDVDILFHESLTIGQKIALTEKIVRVLQTMSCPHKIEPHQIQGMDCIHIFPVIQWLVKKSIETRQQMNEYLKNYANWQFNRCHSSDTSQLSDSLSKADTQSHPKRKYRHPARHKLIDPEIRVRTTLLEYGFIGKSSASDITSGADKSGEQTDNRKNGSDSQLTDSLMTSMQTESNKISAAFVGSIVGAQSEEIQKLAEEYNRHRLEREENSIERKEREIRSRVETAKKELSIAKQKESEIRDKIQLFGQRIEIVKQRQQSFAPKDNEKDEEREEKRNLNCILDALKKQKSEFKQFCREEKQRLEKQIEELSNQTTDTEDETEVETELTDSLMTSMQTESNKISAAFVGSIVGAQSEEIQKLAEEYNRHRLEREENSIERKEREIRSRVETAKKELSIAKQKESEIRDKIQLFGQRIEIVKQRQQSFAPKDNEKDEEREEKRNLNCILDALKKQKSEFKQFCREEKQRLEKQILLNRLRKFDDIPTRAELSQYQKRFIELYNQVAAKHNETKKFYTLYNTLDDERMYLEKELTLIGSILDNFYQAQNSNNVKEEYLLQFEQIVENIKQTKLKVENRRFTEKAKRDELNDSYLELIEKQRLYYKGVKDFKEECKTNEKLIAQLENRKTKNQNRRFTEKAKRDELNDSYLELIEKQRLYYKGVKDFKEECKTNEKLIAQLENRKTKNRTN
ncbi:unnamed protein product [Medioppia subpectinata]|uniref:Coiled-coil domain-containing protein 93 n=1 Tax=Medioppia subpectinata TaxID=1979941 RepID=A0A7R9KUG9_9ACAR|nr:unnamed protein product [Medioppia subpectinata]CAG2108892.1 unnamed protein product [Medioppia subpectinata]